MGSSALEIFLRLSEQLECSYLADFEAVHLLQKMCHVQGAVAKAWIFGAAPRRKPSPLVAMEMANHHCVDVACQSGFVSRRAHLGLFPMGTDALQMMALDDDGKESVGSAAEAIGS